MNKLGPIRRGAALSAAGLLAVFLTGCVVHPIPHHVRGPGIVVVEPGYGSGPGHRHRDRHHRHRGHDRHHHDRNHHGR